MICWLNQIALKQTQAEMCNLWPSTSFLFWEIKNINSLPKEQRPSLLSSVKTLEWNINKDLSWGQEMTLKTKWHCKVLCPTGKLKNKGQYLYEYFSLFWGQNTSVKVQSENLGKASPAHSMGKPKLQSTSLGMPQNMLRSNAHDVFFKSNFWGNLHRKKKTLKKYLSGA